MFFVLDERGPDLDFDVYLFLIEWKLLELWESESNNALNHETIGSLEFYLLIYKAMCTFHWQMFYLLV